MLKLGPHVVNMILATRVLKKYFWWPEDEVRDYNFIFLCRYA